MARFPPSLNEQVGREFGASQQYVAIAVFYDAETLPGLARHFYRQAVEERNHAMMIVQYLLDAGQPVRIPGVEERSEEHTSELQSRQYLVCRLLLEKKKKRKHNLLIR